MVKQNQPDTNRLPERAKGKSIVLTVRQKAEPEATDKQTDEKPVTKKKPKPTPIQAQKASVEAAWNAIRRDVKDSWETIRIASKKRQRDKEHEAGL